MRSVADDHDRIVALVEREGRDQPGGWAPAAAVIAQMRTLGWSRGQGERDLRLLIARGRIQVLHLQRKRWFK